MMRVDAAVLIGIVFLAGAGACGPFSAPNHENGGNDLPPVVIAPEDGPPGGKGKPGVIPTLCATDCGFGEDAIHVYDPYVLGLLNVRTRSLLHRVEAFAVGDDEVAQTVGWVFDENYPEATNANDPNPVLGDGWMSHLDRRIDAVGGSMVRMRTPFGSLYFKPKDPRDTFLYPLPPSYDQAAAAAASPSPDGTGIVVKEEGGMRTYTFTNYLTGVSEQYEWNAARGTHLLARVQGPFPLQRVTIERVPLGGTPAGHVARVIDGDAAAVELRYAADAIQVLGAGGATRPDCLDVMTYRGDCRSLFVARRLPDPHTSYQIVFQRPPLAAGQPPVQMTYFHVKLARTSIERWIDRRGVPWSVLNSSYYSRTLFEGTGHAAAVLGHCTDRMSPNVGRAIINFPYGGEEAYGFGGKPVELVGQMNASYLVTKTTYQRGADGYSTGRVERIDYPDGSAQLFEHEQNGMVKKVTQASGMASAVLYEYSDFGVTGPKDPLGLGYAAGTVVEGPDRLVTRYVYDANFPTQVRRVELWGRNGDAVRQVHEWIAQPTGVPSSGPITYDVIVKAGATAATTRIVSTLTLDAHGRVIGRKDPGETGSYRADMYSAGPNAGLVSRVQYPDGTAKEFDYEPTGSLKSVLELPGNRRVQLKENSLGWLTEVSVDGNTRTIDWTAWGLPRRITDVGPNGRPMATEVKLDGAGRVVAIEEDNKKVQDITRMPRTDARNVTEPCK